MDNSPGAEAYLAAAAQAARAFPIEPVDLTPVWMSENVTFRVTDAADGAAYVLRLHRPGYHDLAALESERAWTVALARDGVGAPVGVRTRQGDWYAPTTMPAGGEVRYAGLSRWTDGELMSEVVGRDGPAREAEHFRALGTLVARLHDQATAWKPPLDFKRHRLDVDGLLGAAPWWGRFWEHPGLTDAERGLISATRWRLAGVLEEVGEDPETFGLIHADLHPANVLCRDGRLSVIDFDDCAFGWHAFDIAVALFYEWTLPRFETVRASFLAGYREARALNPATEALIDTFLIMRGLSLFGWLAQRPEVDPARFWTERKPHILAASEALLASG
jgi:Ser/Thr protein kinase RdoA (MazF antagonist)